MVFTSNKIFDSNVPSETKTDDEGKKWKGMKNELFRFICSFVFRYE